MIEVQCAGCDKVLEVKKGWYKHRTSNGFQNFYHKGCQKRSRVWKDFVNRG